MGSRAIGRPSISFSSFLSPTHQDLSFAVGLGSFFLKSNHRICNFSLFDYNMFQHFGLRLAIGGGSDRNEVGRSGSGGS